MRTILTAVLAAQALAVQNQANVPHLARIESAVQHQVNTQVRRWWHSPRIRFGQDGWRVVIVPNDTPAPDGDPAWHTLDAQGQPVAYVRYGPSWPVSFSHEVIEMTTDPWLKGLEICDPVEHSSYELRGTWVSDFVLPSFYRTNRGMRSEIDRLAPAG